jgi:hypothetical protein
VEVRTQHTTTAWNTIKLPWIWPNCDAEKHRTLHRICLDRLKQEDPAKQQSDDGTEDERAPHRTTKSWVYILKEG